MKQLSLFPAPYPPSTEYLAWMKARGISEDAIRCSRCQYPTMILGANDFTAPGKQFCERCYQAGTKAKALPDG